MKIWRTATYPMRCGYDAAHVIAKGEDYLEIDGLGRKRERCAKCAVRHEPPEPGEPPVDTTVPTAPEPDPQPALHHDVEPEPEPEPALEGDPW